MKAADVVPEESSRCRGRSRNSRDGERERDRAGIEAHAREVPRRPPAGIAPQPRSEGHRGCLEELTELT